MPGTWVTVNDNAVSHYGHAVFGTSNAAVAAGGDAANTEDYDGISWSAGNDTLENSGLYGGNHNGVGTQNAGLIPSCHYNTNPVSPSQEYDGTSWLSGGTPINDGGASSYHAIGTQTAAVMTGGSYWNGSSYPSKADTEEYNGISWSDGNDMIQNGSCPGASGTSSDALFMGGSSSPPIYGSSFHYDGSTWSPSTNLLWNSVGGTGFGIVVHTVLLRMADTSGKHKDAAEFNGTSWSSVDDFPATSKASSYLRPQYDGAGDGFGGAVVQGRSTVNDNSTYEWEGVPFCWNYTAYYKESNKLFKLSGPGSYPKYLEIPGNVDKSTGKMIDDGREVDPGSYTID